MKYGIVGNPVSGKKSLARKRRVLACAAEVLGGDCVVGGLDTTSSRQFAECARDLSKKVDTLVVAGGDGTVSDVINAIDPETTLAYLPLGSACALGQVLGLSFNVEKSAAQIRDGSVHHLDLILCDNDKKAIMASIGINSFTLQTREKLLKIGIKGGMAYGIGTTAAYFKYKRTDVTIDADGEVFTLRNVITTIIAKTPSFGYKMILVPEARIDDGYLHLLAVNVGYFCVAYNLIKSFFVPIRTGEYRKATNVSVTLKEPRFLQIDGNIYKKAKEFEFAILPGALKLTF